MLAHVRARRLAVCEPLLDRPLDRGLGLDDELPLHLRRRDHGVVARGELHLRIGALAVIGHQEWVTFLQVDALPRPGLISRAARSLEEPAGAGAVVAVQLARLTGTTVPFFTALGRDAIGRRSVERLRELGVDPHVAWRDQPSRRGLSLVDHTGDRAITVIGERLTPTAEDSLPWELLQDCDGVFVSATDADGLRRARAARVLTATPRLRLPVLQGAAVQLDALIGSALDPGEQLP